MKPKLQLFDLGGLVKRINSALADSEGFIELDEFVPKKTLPLIDRLKDRKTEARGSYAVIQTVYGDGLINSLLASPSEINMGSVHVETGILAPDSCSGTAYEKMVLRINYPLKLKSGGHIPKCKVEFLRETEEWNSHLQRRTDYQRRGFLWVRTDLTNVLPPEWFIPENAGYMQ